MAGPLGFFKGLYARVLYAMPATAICWSTYEFAKFILSQQSREDYSSSTHQSAHITTKDVLASAAEKVRLDDTIRLGYVLPSTQASPMPDVDDATAEVDGVVAAASIADTKSSRHSSSNANSSSSSSLLPRELPSMSGAGVYSSALSLNTMHTTEPAAAAGRRTGLGFAESRGCST